MTFYSDLFENKLKKIHNSNKTGTHSKYQKLTFVAPNVWFKQILTIKLMLVQTVP